MNYEWNNVFFADSKNKERIYFGEVALQINKINYYLKMQNSRNPFSATEKVKKILCRTMIIWNSPVDILKKRILKN